LYFFVDASGRQPNRKSPKKLSGGPTPMAPYH
jgi:hypothetical protein